MMCGWITKTCLGIALTLCLATASTAQEHQHGAQRDTMQRHQHMEHDSAAMMMHEEMSHEMPMLELGGGWMLIGMAQLMPTFTASLPTDAGTPLERSGLYVTQPAIMTNLESKRSAISLRTTLNFEGITQPWGELNF